MEKEPRLFNRSRFLILIAVLAVSAVLIAYSPNPLFGASIAATILILILFLARPWRGLLCFLLIRASLDISKDYFSLYLTDSFRITGASALSFLLIIGGVLYILAFRISFTRPPLAGLFLIFLAVSLLHFFLVDDLPLSLMEFLRLFSAYLVYLLVWNFCRTERDLRILVNTVILSSLIPIGSGLFQVALERGQFITGFIRTYGTFVHPNPYAFYLIIILALAVNLFLYHRRRRPRFLLLGLICAALICVLLSFTRTAWFGFLIIIFLAAFFRQKKLLWIFFALVLIFGLLSPIRLRFYDLATSFNSLAHRLYIWKGGLEHLPRFPILGRGLGSFVLMDIFGEPAHNDFLRVFFELGLLGLLIYLVLSGALLVRLFLLLRAPLSPYIYSLAVAALSIAVVFLGASTISNILFRPVLQWYFWALMAAALKGACLDREQP